MPRTLRVSPAPVEIRADPCVNISACINMSGWCSRRDMHLVSFEANAEIRVLHMNFSPSTPLAGGAIWAKTTQVAHVEAPAHIFQMTKNAVGLKLHA